MPTYEYRCPNGHDFERFFRSINGADAQVNCPTCGVVAERRISGGAGLLFKGSGFYITDYGKDGKGRRKAEDTAKPAAESKGESGAGKAEPKSESKPPSGMGESAPAKKAPE